MVSSSSSAAGAADDAWDPWGCVALGKTDEQGETSKAHLQTQFTATSSGGLKCNTCSFGVFRVDLMSKTPAGVSGMLTNHLCSNEHKTAVRGQHNKAATQGLHAYFAPKPAAASQGEAGSGGAAAALPTRAAAASLATPFIPQTGDVLSTSEDEEDEAVAAAAAASLIKNFRSLSARAKASVAQRKPAGPVQVLHHPWGLQAEGKEEGQGEKEGGGEGQRGGRGGGGGRRGRGRQWRSGSGAGRG